MTVSLGVRPLGDLHVVPIVDAELDGFLRCAVPSAPTTITDFVPSCAVRIAADSGTFSAFATVRPVMETLTGVPTLSLPISCCRPSARLRRGAAGIERRADQRDLCGNRLVHARHKRTVASSPSFSCCARLCAMCTLASSDEVSITVISGVPAAAVSPAKSGRSVTTPSMGLRISE